MKEDWELKLEALAAERFSVKMVLDLIKPVVREIVEEERRKVTDASASTEQDTNSADVAFEGEGDVLEEGEILHEGSSEEFPGTSEE